MTPEEKAKGFEREGVGGRGESLSREIFIFTVGSIALFFFATATYDFHRRRGQGGFRSTPRSLVEKRSGQKRLELV